MVMEAAFMDDMIYKAPIIKRGICLYDNTVEYEVRIIKWHTLYGSGDYQDSPEIREDQQIECYYAFYEDLCHRGEFHVRSRGYLSLDEAIFSVESKCSVTWIEALAAGQ